MITIEQAITARYRQEFHHATLRGNGSAHHRCRVNGQCKTWKTRPGEFSLPVKYGLRTCFYITHENAEEWSAA